MFEPLLIGICFPFLNSEPWQLRGTVKQESQQNPVGSLCVGHYPASSSLMIVE